MKRIWIGLGLLTGILLVGVWTTVKLNRVHTSISDDLLKSAQAAQTGNWEQADELADNASKCWQDNWHFSAALTDHMALDEIDALFAQSEVYRRNRSTVDYAAACAQLAQYIDAVQEGHQLSWWNLL